MKLAFAPSLKPTLGMAVIDLLDITTDQLWDVIVSSSAIYTENKDTMAIGLASYRPITIDEAVFFYAKKELESGKTDSIKISKVKKVMELSFRASKGKSLRRNSHLKRVSGLMLDIENKSEMPDITPQTVMTSLRIILGKYLMFGYSTFSNSENSLRYRIVIPFKNEEYPWVLSVIQESLGQYDFYRVIDPSSFIPTRFFYLPVVNKIHAGRQVRTDMDEPGFPWIFKTPYTDLFDAQEYCGAHEYIKLFGRASWLRYQQRLQERKLQNSPLN